MDTSSKSNQKVKQPLAGLISGREACRDRRAATQNRRTEAEAAARRWKSTLFSCNNSFICMFLSVSLPFPSFSIHHCDTGCLNEAVFVQLFHYIASHFHFHLCSERSEPGSDESDELPRELSGFGSLAQPTDNRSGPRTPEGWR